MKRKTGQQSCLLCPMPNGQHSEDCQAREQIEIVFPDAPHTKKGQEAARRKWRKRLKKNAEETRARMVKIVGEPHVRRIELAVRATCGKATDEELRELERLNEINA